MRYVGRISEWNDDRGFGFVVPNGGGDRAFVHIKSFARGAGRPVAGLLISYEVVKDDKGRLNAKGVRSAAFKPKAEAAPGRPWPRKTLASLFLVALLLGWFLGRVPMAIAVVYAAMSAITFLVYGADKSAAVDNRRRTPESTLHLMGLIGGWPGALFAQDVFRHKSSKAAFLSVFWFTVVLNCGALAWLLASGHAALFDQAVRP